MTNQYATSPDRRQAIRDNNDRQREVLRGYMINWLQTHPCVDCDERDIIVLEFDHVRGEKKYVISRLVCSSPALTTLQDEIAKCEVRCANCHRRATARRAMENGMPWRKVFAEMPS